MILYTRPGGRAAGTQVISLRRNDAKARGGKETLISTTAGAAPNDDTIDLTPEIVGALPADENDQGVDGLITRAAIGTGVTVNVPQWEDQEEFDFVFLEIDGNIVGDTAGLDPIGQPDPIPVPITAAEMAALTHGTHTLRFYYFNVVSAESKHFSQPYVMRIDLQPAGDGDLPTIQFDDVYYQGISRQDIVDGGNTLTGHIAAYFDMKKGDIIQCYLQNRQGGAQTAGPEIVVASETDAGHDCVFSLAQLDAAVSVGEVDFWYTVTDRAGNIATAGKTALPMLVTGAPDQLIAPRLPPDDGLVIEDDARRPSKVEIPQFGHGVIGDTLYLYFESKASDGTLTTVGPLPVDGALAAGDLPANPANPDPTKSIRTIELAYATFSALQPKTAAGVLESIYSLDIWYEVRRGAFKGMLSPRYTTGVDLTLAGGPDPDPETPVHENLLPPTLQEKDGAGTPNVFPVGYAGPPEAIIPHLSNETPSKEVFAAGDTVQLYRYVDGINDVATGPSTAATVGADLKIVLAATDLVPGHPFYYYRIARTLTPGPGVNEALSPQQSVEVKDTNGLPGGPHALPYAVFREAPVNGAGYMSLVSRGYDGTFLRIYQYLNMDAGDVVEATWRPNRKLTGTPDTEDMTPVVLPRYTVVAADLQPKDDYVDGDPTKPPVPDMKIYVDIPISYKQLRDVVSPTGIRGYGSARVTYTVTNAIGTNASDPDRTKNPFMTIDVRKGPVGK